MSNIKKLFNGSMGIVFTSLFILIGLGDIYWLWMAFKLGSFVMGVIGLFPLFFIITGPVGAWSLLFGMPSWVINMFG